MTLTQDLETITFIILASIVGLFAVYHFKQTPQMQAVSVIAPLTTAFATPTPTPAPVPIPVVNTTSWNSSDGTEELILKTTIAAQKTTYDFTLTNTNTGVSQPFFSQTLPNGDNMSIPFNAFSSDNSYVFLKEVQNNVNHFLVFKTNGTNFANGQQYLDVTALFTNYTTNDTLSDVTGWAGPTLLVINAKATNGATESFWFDASSSSFIPLANVFD